MLICTINAQEEMPKFTKLMQSTGLCCKQIRQYMHNHAQRGKKMAALIKVGKERLDKINFTVPQ